MVVFSTKADYALILLAEMGHSADFMSLGKIAQKKRLPYRYVSRIAAELKRAGLIESKEGVTGGYRLSKKPEHITALEVLRVFDDGISAVKCIAHGKTCPRADSCEMKSRWERMQNELVSVVDTYTLADLM